MKKYLLLRDNKQTGPYSIDDIRALGLKPYDLIWVDGRSAAWRYPGEIDEFKSFAPQVEEQPYDRFYKKSPAETKKASDNQLTEEKPRIIAENKPKIIAAEQDALPKETDPNPKISPVKQQEDTTPPVNASGSTLKNRENEKKRPKYVSVSMPSGIQKPPFPAPIDQREVQPIQKTPTENIQKPAPIVVVQQEKNVIAESKSVKTIVPVHPSNSNRISGNILQVFAIAAAVISLVAVGVLIGMGLGTARIQEAKAAPQETATDAAAKNVSSTPEEVIPQTVNQVQADTAGKIPVTDQKVKPKKQLAKPVINSEPVPVESTVIADPVPQAPAETTKAADAKETARQNLAKLVSVSTNNYKVGMFGGIDDVKVTVYNASEYPLDLVVVDVSYIQSNKKSYKTESLHFNSIAANSSLTLDAPKASKGIKVKTSLTYITSKALGISENIW